MSVTCSVPDLKAWRRCLKQKTLVFFPRDRSRRDGRWHTCRAWRREDWRTRGKLQAVLRMAQRQFERG